MKRNWYDVKNESFCEHKSKFYHALLVLDLVNVLKSYQNRTRAHVYCQRNRTPDIFLRLKEINILVLSFEKGFNSLRKQKDLDYLQNLEALHQSPDLELKPSNKIMNHENDLSQITASSRPKRLSKRARRAMKNLSPAADH